MTAKLPDKPRKHRWVTEAINSGDLTLSVWPDEDDLKTDKTKEGFMSVIAKVGNDPRVIKIEKHGHDKHQVVFVFSLNDD